MKELKTIAIDLGNGFWGMIQEDIRESGVINFFLTHEDYSTMMHVFGIEAEWNEDLLTNHRDALTDATEFYAVNYMD